MSKHVAFSHGLGAVVAASLALSALAAAAEPTLTHLFPVAGQQGSTVSVTSVGKSDPWPPQVWMDSPGLVFKAGEKAGNFEVEIAADARPGPRLIRFFNESGVSEPRFFIVSDRPETLEAEPNDAFQAPQKLASLPATVSGRLDKGGDVDSYAVELKRGQTLVAWLEGYVLASTLDGMLRIVDSNGAQFAFNHDAQTMDPFLAWEAPHDGTFIVQVMGFAYPANAEVRFTGGENCVYRLHLTAGPFVRHTLPLAVPRGAKTSLQLAGWNLPTHTVEVDTTQIPAEETLIRIPGEEILAQQLLAVSEIPEAVEQEPADAAAPVLLPVPGAVTGRISKPDDEDRFAFTAVKQRIYRIQVTSGPVASPLDAWVKLEDPEGKELAKSDDLGSSRDPQLVWTAPADGVFRVAIGDVTHRGGDDFVYRLAIEEAVPAVEATAASHSLKLEPGKPGELKVTVKLLHGFKAKLQLAAKQLPEGISAAEVEVPEKGGEVTLKFEAAAEAPPANLPFQLVLREAEGGKEHLVRYSLVNTSENNGVPQGYSTLVIDSTDQLWITVVKAPAK